MIPNTLILLVISIGLYVYWFYKNSYSFFKKRNIAYLEPKFFFGNIGDAILKKKFIGDVYTEVYRKLEPHRIIGFFKLHKPIYMVRDPELIKAILTKDFGTFPDQGNLKNVEDEPLSNPLTNMTGKQWKNCRIKLTTAFSTGKIKMMFPLMKTGCENLIKFLEKLAPTEAFAIKDLSTRLMIDVMATCVFGLETNTLANPESEFLKIQKEFSRPRIQATIRSYFPNMPKKIIKYLQLYMFDKKVQIFFSKVVQDMVKYREDNETSRDDYFDLLNRLKKNSDVYKGQDKREEKEFKKYPDHGFVDMTTALMVSLFLAVLTAGSVSTSYPLNFLLIELALNPDIQNNLRKEITDVCPTGEELTYEKIKEMKYADMVISENFRLHPPLPMIFRRCENNYKIPNSEIVIKKNDVILIPILALHTDKKYYARPDTFYPEHFSEEAITNRPHISYLPSGDGPRKCIAARFSAIVIKTALIRLLKEFSFHLSPKTKFPLEYTLNHMGIIIVKNEIWLHCEKS